MARSHGTNGRGGAFTHEEMSAAWNKAKIVEGYDKNKFRKDLCGAWIEWPQHGNTNHKEDRGWEVDHIKPVAAGGSDHPDNLQALHWKNNRAKGDDTTGKWQCAVKASK